MTASGEDRSAGSAHRQGRAYELDFAADAAGRSFLDAQFARYPVHICRGLHVNEAVPNACAVNLQSVSGGLFEGDDVSGRIRAHAGAWVQVATAASTIVHTMRGGTAVQRVELEAAAGAYLEYLPEPLILFPASRLRSEVEVRAAPGSTVVVSEAFLCHDPRAGGSPFDRLEAIVRLVRTDGKLLARERLCIAGADWAGKQVGVSNRFAAHGGLWIVKGGDVADLQRILRDTLDREQVHGGVSELPNRAGLQARLLAIDAVSLRRALRALQADVQRTCFAERKAASATPADRMPSTTPVPA